MKKEQFNKLNTNQRLKFIKEKGIYLGARSTTIHFIYLYSLNSLFIEVFMLKQLNQIQYIEIQTNNSILSDYVSDVNIQNLFE